MVNYAVLIGKIYQDIIKNKDNSYKIILEVPRNYKNLNGLYDFDIIPIKLNNDIGNKVIKYCKKGNMVAVKAKIECLEDEKITLVAYDVTYFSSSNN